MFKVAGIHWLECYKDTLPSDTSADKRIFWFGLCCIGPNIGDVRKFICFTPMLHFLEICREGHLKEVSLYSWLVKVEMVHPLSGLHTKLKGGQKAAETLAMPSTAEHEFCSNQCYLKFMV